jgi:hypothetical protein
MASTNFGQSKSDSSTTRPLPPAGDGGVHRTQLIEKKKRKRKKQKDFSFFLSSSLWEEMWVEIQKPEIAEQYHYSMALRLSTSSATPATSARG